MQKLTLLILLLCATVQFSYAQKSNIEAIVQDSLGETIIGASVMLTTKADSTLSGFGLTDEKGYFVINNIENGEYFLQITYMGYRTHVEYVKMAGTDKDLGNIVLQEGNTMLEEVVVMEDRIPILIKKDTIEYNAGSFTTKENATVEDLIKQLPGMEVEEDGSVKAQGKKVEKVLVDGKEFFGNDPTIATKNLPADAVDKVQVYDDKTEEQKFSGVETGEKTKTMNLKLKEDKKQGYFGKVYAGGGTAKTYTGGFSLSRFSKTQQLSVISKFNNINSAGFSYGEYRDFAGNQGVEWEEDENGNFVSAASVPISWGRGRGGGNKVSNIVGLNYGQDFSKKFKLTSHYTLSTMIDTVSTKSKRTTYVADADDFISNEQAFTENKYIKHNVGLKWTYDIDSTQQFLLKNKVAVSNGSGRNTSNARNNTGGRLVSTANHASENDNSSLSFRNTLRYRKRFKPGRTLMANTTFNYSKNDRNTQTISLNDIYNSFAAVEHRNLDRNRDYIGKRISWSQNVSYVEPIGKNWSWINLIDASRDVTKQDNEVIDNENGTPVQVVNLSRDFTFDKWRQRFKSNLTYSKEKYDITVGGRVERLELFIKDDVQTLFKKPYWFILPSAVFQYKTGKQGSFTLDYMPRYRVPNYSDLQPLRDDTNPLRATLGNPNLDPEYTHSFAMSYYMFDNFSFTNIFTNASYNITPNSIIRKTLINADFVETTQAVNEGTTHNANVGFSYGRPLNFMKAKLNTRISFNYNDVPFWVNEVRARRRNVSPGFNVSLSNKNKTNWDLSLRYSYNYNKNTSTNDAVADVNYTNQGIRVKVNYFFEKRWSLGTNANYNTYSSTAFNENNNFLLWNAFLEMTMFKDDKGSLRLSAYDILNQNRGVARTANSFYILETDTNNLGRYVMLTFSYKLSFFGR